MWTFCTLERWFWKNFWANRLYESKQLVIDFWCVAQKLPCLNSLFSGHSRGVVVYEKQPTRVPSEERSWQILASHADVRKENFCIQFLSYDMCGFNLSGMVLRILCIAHSASKEIRPFLKLKTIKMLTQKNRCGRFWEVITHEGSIVQLNLH